MTIIFDYNAERCTPYEVKLKDPTCSFCKCPTLRLYEYAVDSPVQPYGYGGPYPTGFISLGTTYKFTFACVTCGANSTVKSERIRQLQSKKHPNILVMECELGYR